MRLSGVLVESRGNIIYHPSQLDLGVLVSPPPAPDVLDFRLYSRECNLLG